MCYIDGQKNKYSLSDDNAIKTKDVLETIIHVWLWCCKKCILPPFRTAFLVA
jgi:hypothetical protein